MRCRERELRAHLTADDRWAESEMKIRNSRPRACASNRHNWSYFFVIFFILFFVCVCQREVPLKHVTFIIITAALKITTQPISSHLISPSELIKTKAQHKQMVRHFIFHCSIPRKQLETVEHKQLKTFKSVATRLTSPNNRAAEPSLLLLL